MKFLAGFISAIVISGVIAVAVIYSGAYNVAASEPHTSVGTWLLNKTMQRSVATRATMIAAPQRLTDEDAQLGLEVFTAKCVPCHGGPGKERGDIAKGLRPEPPDLAQAARSWSSAELFWIVKHGIRMTGMPAFGQAHDDRQLWSVVALVQRLPNMTPEQYKRMEQATGSQSREPRKK